MVFTFIMVPKYGKMHSSVNRDPVDMKIQS